MNKQIQEPNTQTVIETNDKETRPFIDIVLYDGSNKSNTKSTSKLEIPRWVAVFEEEAKKPLAVIGIKRDDIKQAARDYKLMQDLYEGVSTIRDAAVRFLLEAQGKKPDPIFDPLNLDTINRCIDHHAQELFRLRGKVQHLEKLLEQRNEP